MGGDQKAYKMRPSAKLMSTIEVKQDAAYCHNRKLEREFERLALLHIPLTTIKFTAAGIPCQLDWVRNRQLK